jgi:heptosyltransferase-2/heptosyltransferase-3
LDLDKLDREGLVLRNKSMAAAFHAVPLKHQLRRMALTLAAELPISQARKTTDRILLIRPDHLGDVLLTTPAIRALRHAHPHAELHALVGPWSANVLANLADLDVVLTLPFPGFSRSEKVNWRSPYKLVVESSRILRRIGYDTAIIFRPDHWWGALLAHLAGIPRRIGYNLPNVAPFLTEAIEHKRNHAVMQSARLVEPLTGELQAHELPLDFQVEASERAWISGYLDEWGVDQGTPLVAIHPGSGTWVKAWDEAKWASVADALAGQLDGLVVLTGSDLELPLCQRIAARMKRQPIIMAGDTGIGTLAALFQRCEVVLGPDSGPLHLAVAVDTPTVALFGPADPAEFGLWGSSERHKVLTSDIGCRPCRVLDWGSDDPAFHPCVREINSARVLDAARRAMSTNR